MNLISNFWKKVCKFISFFHIECKSNFYSTGADFVKVDESLFQNLDDLDLDDDDDDDEDYVPGDSDES